MANSKKKTNENPTNRSMATVKSHIKEGQFSRLYLLFGDEPYLVNQYKHALLEALISPDDTMNFTTYNKDSFDINAVMNDALTMPFLSEHRVVLVEDSGFFDLSDSDYLSSLPQVPDTNVIIFCERSVTKNKKAYLHTNKNELASCLEFNTPDMQTLNKWIIGILSEGDMKVRATVPDRFLDAYGEERNMYLLKNEATKLHDYCLEKGTILDEDVDMLCSNSVEDKIFDMCKYISQKKSAQALQIYNDLCSIKTQPMTIISLITWKYNQLSQVKQLLNEGANVGTIASKIKLSPSFTRDIINTAKNYSQKEILSAIDLCYDMRLAITSGRLLDYNASEKLIVTLLKR